MARHLMAEECALNKKVSTKATEEEFSEDRSDIDAVMPCRTRSYDPVIIWMTGAVVFTSTWTLVLASLVPLAVFVSASWEPSVLLRFDIVILGG